MPETLMRASRALRRVLPRENHTTIARREHDEAMRDRGVAADHAASIARAVTSGKPGCEFCG